MTEDRRRRKGRPKNGPEREIRRQELLDAAVRAIRADGEEVSMDAIAAEAGITKPILYSHFGDKAGLAEALAQQFNGILTQLLIDGVDRTLPTRDTLLAMIDVYVSLIDAEPKLYRFLINGPAASNGRRQLIEDLATLVARDLGQRLRAEGADSGGAEPWAYGIVGMVDLAASWWLDRQTMSRSDLVEYLTKLIWGGLSANGLGTQEPAVVSDLTRRTAAPPRSVRATPT